MIEADNGLPAPDRLVELIKQRKLIVMRRPPWKCAYCRSKTVDQLKWISQGDDGHFAVTCSTCGKVVYT